MQSKKTSGYHKPGIPQIALGLVLLVLIMATGFLLFRKSPRLAFFWISGNLFGYVLQRGRFCFAAAFRDPALTGGTSLTRAVLIALGLTTLGFSVIKWAQWSQGLPMSGQAFLVPASVATFIGSFFFGMGSVVAGGCASGTLMRVGEGATLNLLTLFSFMLGGVLATSHFGWWQKTMIEGAPSIFLPNILGWPLALLLQLGLIALLYFLAKRYEIRRKGGGRA